MKNGTKKRAARNGKADADDIEEMFRAINTPRPDLAAPADGAGKAEILAALADGSLLAPGADGLERLGEAIRRGWLDDADAVSDATRRKIIDHVAVRVREGGVAEKIAAAGAWDAIMGRPNVRARPGEAAPSDSESDGAPPGPGKPPPGGRTKDGKFCRGNRISLGNAGARRQSALRGALLKTLDEDKLQALGEALYRRGLDGDMEAVKVLLGYALGKPGPAPDPDRLDADEFAVLTAGPSLARLWLGVHEAVDPQFACAVWRKLSCASADAATDQLVGAVEAEPQRFAKDLDRVRARAAAVGR
jgi:hypothetical protein